MPEPAARAVVSSDDGSTISLTIYTAAGDAVPVALLPVRAVALAGELIAAAVPKLNVTAKSAATQPVENKPTKRRGGDPNAEQRRRRDEAICALANLTGKGKPIERQARDIAQRLDRYRPMPVETKPERRLMQEIKHSGLPIGRRRISKILRDQTGALVAQRPARD
jgi:hypothetical protein